VKLLTSGERCSQRLEYHLGGESPNNLGVNMYLEYGTLTIRDTKRLFIEPVEMGIIREPLTLKEGLTKTVENLSRGLSFVPVDTYLSITDLERFDEHKNSAINKNLKLIQVEFTGRSPDATRTRINHEKLPLYMKPVAYERFGDGMPINLAIDIAVALKGYRKPTRKEIAKIKRLGSRTIFIG
jgi:hypothetical protein